MSTNFGPEFERSWTPSTDFKNLPSISKHLFENCKEVQPPSPDQVKIEDVLKNSKEFPIPWPISTCRIVAQSPERLDIIEKQAASAYPVVHERVLWLFLKFLELKSQFGTQIEKRLYTGMSLTDFVQRLLSKRAVTFYMRNDKYLLLNGERGASGFDAIGTDKETFPLLLESCLSYDEIKLSALLSVSSHTEFINDGERKNGGRVETDLSKIERSGVVVGLIGARLSRRDLMEFQDIVISKSQNTHRNGYGDAAKDEDTPKSALRKMWSDFYEQGDLLFTEVQKDGQRFGNSRNKDDVFDNLIMKKRYQISIDTFLLESDARAAAVNKQGYLHVVGIGLGVWRTSAQQEEIFLRVFEERLKALRLKNVGFVHFSWFGMQKCGQIENGGIIKDAEHPKGGIRVFVSKRNPGEKLKGPELDNALAIVSYAWDGNALPGNEFWVGKTTCTGDPAAACSTLITELHNPHINTDTVSGRNLHIASPEFGVVHLSKYAKLKSM